MDKRILIVAAAAVICVVAAFALLNSSPGATPGTTPGTTPSAPPTTTQTQSDPCLTMPAKEISLTESTTLLYHIHPVLHITILGTPQILPDNVGRTDTVLRPIHTHDSTGTLHVESPCLRDYTLGDFFSIWGQEFNSTCIMGHCNDGTHSVKMTVDGSPSNAFENLVLRDGQNIVISYE